MTRFEAARIIGIRAMQLSEGATPDVNVGDSSLRNDYTYVAARELYERTLDVCVDRNNDLIHISNMRIPVEVVSMISTRDGQNRINC
jgi:DNA-directed RNA polymerase subunit K/omega